MYIIKKMKTKDFNSDVLDFIKNVIGIKPGNTKSIVTTESRIIFNTVMGDYTFSVESHEEYDGSDDEIILYF